MIPAGRAPERIATERLVLRGYKPGDAAAVKEAIDSSLDHLRVFMDWAWLAPEPVEVVEERLGLFAASFALGEDFVYGMFAPDGRSTSEGRAFTGAWGPVRSRSVTGSGRASSGRGLRPRPRRR